VEPGESRRRPEAWLFNETQTRIVLSVKRNNASAALALLEWRGVPARRLGAVTKATSLKISANGRSFMWSLAELDGFWSNAIETLMRGEL
jgi:phosphoribosylformylglycinamidine (FGAM) synthase-like enzyme